MVLGGQRIVPRGDARNRRLQLAPLRAVGQRFDEIKDTRRRAELVALLVARHTPQLKHDVQIVRDALVARRFVWVEVEAFFEARPYDRRYAQAARLVRREEDAIAIFRTSVTRSSNRIRLASELKRKTRGREGDAMIAGNYQGECKCSICWRTGAAMWFA